MDFIRGHCRPAETSRSNIDFAFRFDAAWQGE
jgi:hypothetical protein